MLLAAHCCICCPHPQVQVSDADIDPVQELPALEGLKAAAEGANIAVRARPPLPMQLLLLPCCRTWLVYGGSGCLVAPDLPPAAAPAAVRATPAFTHCPSTRPSLLLPPCTPRTPRLPAGASEADGGAEAERRAGHQHGPGESQEPAGGEERENLPGPHRGADQAHAPEVWCVGVCACVCLCVCVCVCAGWLVRAGGWGQAGWLAPVCCCWLAGVLLLCPVFSNQPKTCWGTMLGGSVPRLTAPHCASLLCAGWCCCRCCRCCLPTPAGSQVRFILMNSFSTSEDTRGYLRKGHAGEAAVPGRH